MKRTDIQTDHKYSQGYILKFERLFNDLVFARQEAGLLHNTEEWVYWIYDCM